MILLTAYAFLAGIVTILSPCILPILPVILTSTVGGRPAGAGRPFGVVIGFITSFTFFTLFLTTIVRLIGIPADTLRILAVIIIAGFGISLLVPRFQMLVERLFSRFASRMPGTGTRTGFGGGLLIGLSIGLLWTPCVGPILASVISLSITGTVTFDSFIITFAYSLGTAIPMFAVMLGGRHALSRVPWLLARLKHIQKIFGILMIITAVGIFYGVDRSFQTYILNTFPQYGTGLTAVEDNEVVRNELDKQTSDSVNQKGTPAPEIIPGGTWFNSDPLTLKQLRGKVVIIDFWTYSCINCQRTFPYLRKWHETYKDKGLVIIGVHSPEFEFEKSEKNVATAIEDFNLTYPVVQDNDFATWRAYNNRYWPAKYIIDKEGYIRYQHFGEGAYDETEEIIQELLEEAGAENITTEVSNPSYDIYSRTPEIYLGYARIDHFVSPEEIVRDKVSSYTIPQRIGTNEMAYQGNWSIMDEYANPRKGSSLALNFEAKEVFLVMRTRGTPSQVRVSVDNGGENLGADVTDGLVTVTKDTLYKLVLLPEPGRHTLRLEFLDDNTELYAFTFG